MTDEDLADEIISRINVMLQTHEDVRQDITRLFETRIPCSAATLNLTDIQCVQPEGNTWYFGSLGLLNGLCGIIKEGSKLGWGHITAVYDTDTGLVQELRRTR